MSIFESILLGIVQGLTEFLPVSSSGHLVITSNILGLKPDLAFITVVHFATLLAVLVYFFKDIILLIQNFFGGLFGLILKKKSISETYDNPYFKIATLIIVGTVPTVIIALSLKDWFESLFSSIFAVGCFLILTGIILLLSEKLSSPKKSEKDMNMLDSIVIGIFQGMAVAPGLSRSGLTVSASL
ncbi:undecaprenyl-diphosphate phosphatase, partial [Candidatus Margulisiibacteriota bacterium]